MRSAHPAVTDFGAKQYATLEMMQLDRVKSSSFCRESFLASWKTVLADEPRVSVTRRTTWDASRPTLYSESCITKSRREMARGPIVVLSPKICRSKFKLKTRRWRWGMKACRGRRMNMYRIPGGYQYGAKSTWSWAISRPGVMNRLGRQGT